MEKTYLYSDYDVAENAVEAEKNINTRNENNNYNQVAFDTKNYLNVRLDPGQTEKTLKIRLLPFPDTKTPFLHIHMHTIRVPKEIAASGWKSYVCLEKTEGLDTENLGTKCPFCDLARSAYKDAKNELDPQKKEILRQRGKENLSSEFVVMRCIERGKEDEGVKFWKVKIHQDKGDPYNLICTLAETRKREWFEDPENNGKDPRESNILSINPYGYDLQITIKKKTEVDKRGQTVEKTSYQVTDAKKPSPLSADLEQGKAWVLDPKKWFEVFVPKPYDYLAIVMQGKMPWYDRGIGKWVSKEEKDEQQQAEVERANEEIRRAEEVSAQALAPQTVQKQMEEDPVGVFSNSPEDDLPF